MLNWKFYLFIFIMLIFLSSVWGNDDFRRVEIKHSTKKEIPSVGMALRQRVYPHPNKNEVKLYLLWNANFADQAMMYQKSRLNGSNMRDLAKTKYIAVTKRNHLNRSKVYGRRKY